MRDPDVRPIRRAATSRGRGVGWGRGARRPRAPRTTRGLCVVRAGRSRRRSDTGCDAARPGDGKRLPRRGGGRSLGTGRRRDAGDAEKIRAEAQSPSPASTSASCPPSTSPAWEVMLSLSGPSWVGAASYSALLFPRVAQRAQNDRHRSKRQHDAPIPRRDTRNQQPKRRGKDPVQGSCPNVVAEAHTKSF